MNTTLIFREHCTNAVHKGLKIVATETKMEHRSMTVRWLQDQIYRVSLEVEGRTRRDVFLWDEIAVNEDTSNSPKYNDSKDERLTPWSDWKMINSDKSGQVTEVTTNPKWSLVSYLIREQSHARESRYRKRQRSTILLLFERGKRKETRRRTRTRSGDSDETNHKLHPSQDPGREAPDSWEGKTNWVSLSYFLLC